MNKHQKHQGIDCVLPKTIKMALMFRAERRVGPRFPIQKAKLALWQLGKYPEVEENIMRLRLSTQSEVRADYG